MSDSSLNWANFYLDLQQFGAQHVLYQYAFQNENFYAVLPTMVVEKIESKIKTMELMQLF